MLIQPYYIGWGRLVQLAKKYRRLLPLIVRGTQGDGQQVKRTNWLPTIKRDLALIFARNPKHLLHRPWQAEYDTQRFARRSFTASGARKMLRDVLFQQRTNKRSPYQSLRWRLVRRWDRKHLSHLPGYNDFKENS